MTIDELNLSLSMLAEKPSREAALKTAFGLAEWMGLAPNNDGKERLLQVQKQELKKYIVNHPLTAQPQLYRLCADGQNVLVRLAVVKKLRKDGLRQLIDKESKMEYQTAPPVIQQLPTAPPYHLHIVATEKYDGLYVVLHQGEQKRIMALRKKLTQTQRNKIVPQWQNIAAKSKPEIAQQFWKSLDLKEVNKDFYKQIKERFDALLGIARQQQPGIAEAEVKQFAVRLIGRYIFCWFLKEKGIIPEALLSSATVEQYPQHFFQQYLTKLFFETLNTEVTDGQRSQTTTGLDALYQHIPYLNGGLFDHHPEDHLFAKLDLNAWLAVFVKVLENFDFTVDESSSQYQLVAIDPEMLGRIFENLLASQNKETEKLANERKAFGAFYTPREIVDYMVNESLKAHLETALLPSLPQQPEETVVNEPLTTYRGTLFEQAEPRQTLINFNGKERAALAEAVKKRDRLKEKIVKLFAPDCAESPFDKDETTEVRKALTEVKVLDPACGSGAFPMGVLLRLMELRQLTGHGHRNNYDLKAEILSRNIFGVDIMPMAVEIARLRAWLSLVLEADYKPADRKNNFGVAALPNLDFKFVCANSLIDSGYDTFLHHVEISGTLTLMRLHGEIQKLEDIREQYFDPRGDKHKKENLQADFIATKNYIKQEFAPLKKTWNLEGFLSKVDDWTPFDDSHPSSFFSPAWMFGVTDGFDVVIGNPPYVNVENLSEIIKYNLYKNYKTVQGRTDIYIAFIERLMEQVKKGATLSFIIPYPYTNQNYGLLSRKMLIENYYVKEIIDTSDYYVFESAVVKNIILRVMNTKSNAETLIRRATSDNNFQTNSFFEFTINQKEFLTMKDYRFETKNISDTLVLKSKIWNNSICLEEICLIAYGARLNHKSEKIGKEHFIHKDFKKGYKLFTEGKNINRYSFTQYGWLDFQQDEHYNSMFPELFENEKIILIRIIKDRLRFAFDNENFYNSHTVINCVKWNLLQKATHITVRKNISKKKIYEAENFNYLFLLAVLNSSLINWYFFHFLSDNLNFYPESARKLPIAKTANQQPFISRVEKILSQKQQNKPTTDLEKEIDVLVYKLYELSYAEVKIIDPAFWLTEQEYAKVEMK